MSNRTKIVIIVIVIICLVIGIAIFVNKKDTVEKTNENTEGINEYNNELRVQKDNKNVDTNEIKNRVEDNMRKLKNNNI